MVRIPFPIRKTSELFWVSARTADRRQVLLTQVGQGLAGAPRPGLEPGTNRLTAGCSTIELSGIGRTPKFYRPRRPPVQEEPLSRRSLLTPTRCPPSSDSYSGCDLRSVPAAMAPAGLRRLTRGHADPCGWPPSSRRSAPAP